MRKEADGLQGKKNKEDLALEMRIHGHTRPEKSREAKIKDGKDTRGRVSARTRLHITLHKANVFSFQLHLVKS